MPCSRALRARRSVCSFGIGTASLSISSPHGRKHGRRMRELREHDEPHRQERRAAGDGRVDHRQHAVGVRAHVRAVERIRQIGLAGGGGVSDRCRSSGVTSCLNSQGLTSTGRKLSGAGRRRSGIDADGSVGTARSRARVVALEVLAMRLRPRIVFAWTVRIAAHPEKRERRDRVRRGGTRVHLLAVAVSVEQERARPAGGQRRQRARRTPARARRRAARSRTCRRSRGGAGGRPLRACSVRASLSTGRRSTRASSRSRTARGHPGESRPRTRASAGRRRPGRGASAGTRTRRRIGDENLIPVDPHVGDDADLARGRQELPLQIDGDSLRPADREADLIDDRRHVPDAILHLQRRRAPSTAPAWEAATLSFENA